MMEISSDHRMAQITPTLRAQGQRIFGKKPAQIFAPVNDEGGLVFGYLFARSTSLSLVRKLARIRGVGEMATVCDDEGMFKHAVQVPHSDVLEMIKAHTPPAHAGIRAGDFVEILTGESSKYCGTVADVTATGKVCVEVVFPTGRSFIVSADTTSVKKLPKTPVARRAFWGILG
jgi:hypothetical protein